MEEAQQLMQHAVDQLPAAERVLCRAWLDAVLDMVANGQDIRLIAETAPQSWLVIAAYLFKVIGISHE